MQLQIAFAKHRDAVQSRSLWLDPVDTKHCASMQACVPFIGEWRRRPSDVYHCTRMQNRCAFLYVVARVQHTITSEKTRTHIRMINVTKWNFLSQSAHVLGANTCTLSETSSSCVQLTCVYYQYIIYIWYIRYNIATAQHTKHICFCLRNRPAKPLVTGAKKFVWQQLLRARSQFFHSYAHTAIKSAMPRHRGGSAAPTYPLLGLNAIKCAAKDTF